MREWIANARMYAVTPEVEAAWRTLLEHVAADAGVALRYLPYPAPQPLEALWARPDLGAVLMCGYPLAQRLAPALPLAAPIPSVRWAGGRAVYRTDLIVRAEAPYQHLEDTFGARSGWSVSHSQSGFNAWRYALLAHRSAARPALYREVADNLITARAVLDAVREGRIDIGPLDAYWHLLIRTHAPQLTAGVRTLCSTALTPMPPFVTAQDAPAAQSAALRAALVDAHRQPWFAACAAPLQLAGFAAVELEDYAELLAWDEAARTAGYPLPA
ncbi:MAG: PhnD/SsuA/transferrin family substrate-binding protein [Gammaproteobacteria bacterium]|nr:PhnD/SsuA/transferrin family substrate-binding protein [Gammaproteobacteria bacterium]MBV9697581.1 PhnD/SsuA/transferrin family substrate-binding protein [Gammaproteobacteria bacterium]